MLRILVLSTLLATSAPVLAQSQMPAAGNGKMPPGMTMGSGAMGMEMPGDAQMMAMPGMEEMMQGMMKMMAAMQGNMMQGNTGAPGMNGATGVAGLNCRLAGLANRAMAAKRALRRFMGFPG